MKRPELDNKALDALGKQLICRSTPRTDEIENLIANPHLYEMVLAKIGSEVQVSSARKGAASPFFLLFRSNLAKLASTFAILAIAVVATTFFNKAKPMVTPLEVQFPETIPAFARPVSPPKFSYELSQGRATFSDIRAPEPDARHIVKTVYREPKANSTGENDGEFYQLTVAGDPNDLLGGERIIRVDMKRSSLLSLGVNLPLENESETVKAELLVGPDGVTRGVRVIK